jgi:hypothetical protein
MKRWFEGTFLGGASPNRRAWIQGAFAVSVVGTLAAAGRAPVTTAFSGASEAGSPDLPALWPGDRWTGSPSSGFPDSGPYAPSDPNGYQDPVWDEARGKPWLRALFAPGFSLDQDTIIAFDAGHPTGVAHVEFNFEGRIVKVAHATLHHYTDVNGVAKFFHGYAVRLSLAPWLALHAAGDADLYVKAVPTSQTAQPRVMGPYRMRGRSTSTKYQFRANIDPTRSTDTSATPKRFQTIAAALDYQNRNKLRQTLLTVVANGPLDLAGAVLKAYNGADRAWTVVTHAPGVVANLLSTAPNQLCRLKYDGICWRGSGIHIDPMALGTYYQEDAAVQGVCFDGCTVRQANGASAMNPVTLTVPLQYWVRRPLPPIPLLPIYFLDCVGSDLFNGFSYATLVRGCTLTNLSGDALQNNRCIHNTVVTTLDPRAVRNHPGNNALTVSYSGGSRGVVLKATGAPNSNKRVLSLWADGAQVGVSKNLDAVVNGGGHTFANVADWLNGLGLAGLSASVVAPAGAQRRALHISHTSLASTTVAFPEGGIAIKPAGTVFTAIIDVHPDFQQNFGYSAAYPVMENCAYRFVTFADSQDPSAQYIFNDHTNSIFRSMGYRNYQTKATNASRSHLNSPHHTCLFEGLTHDNLFNLTLRNANPAENFQPTNVVIRYCVLDRFAFAMSPGAAESELKGLTLDHNYVRTGAHPRGSTNTNSPRSASWNSLVKDEPHSDFTPVPGGPLDLGGGDVIGRYKTDGSENLRD